jgi:RNA polymerase sigma-70 factor (ECF subfamily)
VSLRLGGRRDTNWSRGRFMCPQGTTTSACNGRQCAGHNGCMGPTARFEHLYITHASRVLGYLMRRTDASTADEVLAEVFAVCWRRIDEVPADALPWLFEVARRVLSTQRRSGQRRAALQARLRAITPERIEDAPAMPRDSSLSRALESLTSKDRELLLLIAWEGLTPTQAAAALGVKSATVRVRLTRARSRLARHIERSGGCPQPSPHLPMESP